MKSSMISDRLRLLVDAYCTDGIDEAQVCELETLLRQDAEARRYFSAFCRMHAELFFAAKAEHAMQAVQEVLRPRPARFAGAGILGNAWGETVRYFSQVGPLSYLIATILFGLGLLIGSWVTVGGSHRLLEGPVVEHSLPLPGHALPLPNHNAATPGPRVARVTGTAACRWIDPATRIAEGDAVAVGDRLTLAAGLVEVTYDTGARVILQGPCAYRVDSVRGGFLSIGRLTARVDKTTGGLQPPTGGEGSANEAKGPRASGSPSSVTGPSPLFTVHTPTATVTDLGTEFGVEVSAEGRTDARVFEGSVRVAADGDKQNKQAKPSRDRQRVCRKGESVRVEPNGGVVRVVPAKETSDRGYVRSLPARRAPVESQASYAKYVLSLDPLFYYRMERPQSERLRQIVFDSAPSGHHGEIHIDNPMQGSPYRPGRFGDSLDFRACGGVDVLNYPVPMSDELAVSVWILVTGRPLRISVASNRGVPRGVEFTLGLLFGDGELGAVVKRSDGQKVVIREGVPLAHGEWHHVAMTCDGKVARLYRDGKDVASCRFGEAAGGQSVGKTDKKEKIDNRGIMRSDGQASGERSETRVDELALFDRAISADVIERLFRGGSSRDQSPETTRSQGERR